MKKLLVLFILSCLVFPLFSQGVPISFRFSVEDLLLLSENLELNIILRVFHNKGIAVTGTVVAYREFEDSIQVILGDPTGSLTSEIWCVFNLRLANTLRSLAVGDSVSVAGIYMAGVSAGSPRREIIFLNCVLM